jgi:uncharacterized protein (TIGR03382 family)
VTGATIAHGAAPSATAITTPRGTLGTTAIDAQAPSGRPAFAIATPPTSGSAMVGSDGAVRVCPDPDFVGDDSVTVAITDGDRGVALAIPIHVTDGVGGTCTLDAGGCCSSGRGAGGSLPLALGTFAALRRRRRC